MPLIIPNKMYDLLIEYYFRFSATSYVTFYRGAVATCNDHGFKQNKEQFSEKCRNWRGRFYLQYFDQFSIVLCALICLHA